MSAAVQVLRLSLSHSSSTGKSAGATHLFILLDRQKSIEVYAQSLAQQQRTALHNHAMAKGMNNVQGSSINQQGLDDHQEMFTGNTPPGQPQGNHDSQDYQLQLMMLDSRRRDC